MKKILPPVIFVVGILVLVAGYFLFIRKPAEEPIEEEEVALVEVPDDKAPVAALIPRADGHWLDLAVTKLNFMADEFNAVSMDYELLYKLPDGRTQGVPGSVKLAGNTNIERELLLGSESSGKFRYDEGVEGGTLTLRFRNEKGKLLTKFATDFTFQTGNELTSSDGKLTYEVSSTPKGYFVVMNTFGYPETPPGTLTTDAYGIFTSSDSPVPGTLTIEGASSFYRWGDEREDQETLNATGEMDDVGIFAGISETPEG